MTADGVKPEDDGEPLSHKLIEETLKRDHDGSAPISGEQVNEELAEMDSLGL